MDPEAGVSLGYAPNNFVIDRTRRDPRLQHFETELASLLLAL
jgi:hypothetical protein